MNFKAQRRQQKVDVLLIISSEWLRSKEREYIHTSVPPHLFCVSIEIEKEGRFHGVFEMKASYLIGFF